MSYLSNLRIALDVSDGLTNIVSARPSPVSWVPATGLPKREVVSLTGSAFTALSPPTGAKVVVVLVPNTVSTLTIKGLTADTGIIITPSSNALGLPIVLPLGSSPSVGILNGSATAVSVTVVWA